MKNGWMILVLLATSGATALRAETPAADPRVTPVVLAYRLAQPAVVNISAEKIVEVGPFGNDPLDQVFPFPTPFNRRVPVQSLGSGVLISPAGYIVTNSHVVRKASKITVSTGEKVNYSARMISADPEHDLAILKIDPPAGMALPCLPLGRSDDLMVGETVIAVGNPLGYTSSVTVGVVSAVGRTLEFAEGVKYADLIQTDAPINPGNSGGPLLNIKGELVGINSAIRADAQNIGFAISIDTVARQLCRLMDFERINRVVFGASVGPGKSGDRRPYVQAVRPGSPAEGKLRAGDCLLAADTQPLRHLAEYAAAMMAMREGRTVSFRVLRDGKEQTVAVALLTRPKPDGKQLALRHFGLTLKPVTPQLARDLGLSIDHGLLVTGLDPDSPAAQLGIQLKDVVFLLDRYYVKSYEELGALLEDLPPGQAIRIGIARGNVAATTQIRARTGGAPASTPAPGAAPKKGTAI